MIDNTNNFLIIDGNNLVHRCYHASKHLPWESEVKGIFIFLRVIISLLKSSNYQKVLVVFDSGKVNFRHQISLEYKVNRSETPPQLLDQLFALQDMLNDTGIAMVKLSNYEADDLIASFISLNSKLYWDWNFFIFSQDKDLLQMLSPQVHACKYEKSKVTSFTYQDFCQKYGFSPVNFVDYLCLLGDKADNIIGVKGIGPKWAQKLIQQFGTIESIYQNLSHLPKETQSILNQGYEQVLKNKKLIDLEKNLTCPVNWEQCDFDWEKWKKNPKLIEFCQKNKFRSILNYLEQPQKKLKNSAITKS